MLRKDLLRLAEGIAEIRNSGRQLPWKVSFALVMNARTLEGVVAAAAAAAVGEWDDVLNDWERERKALIEALALRHPDGSIVTVIPPGQNLATAVMKDQQAWDKAFRALHDTHREALEAATRQKADRWSEINDETADDVAIVKVAPAVWEAIEGLIGVELVDKLMPMIDLGEEPPRPPPLLGELIPPMTPPGGPR